MAQPNPAAAPGAAPAGTAPALAASSYVDWPAIFAGAVVASAIAFVLTAFGAALGLSIVSPYRAEGASATAVAIAIGLWFVWIALVSYSAGGYIAGRLRRRVHDATEHESDVRDASHGAIVWGAATLIGAALLVAGVYGTGNLVMQGASSAAGAAAAAGAQQGDRARTGQAETAGPYTLVIDRMYAGGDEATKPGGDAARRSAALVFAQTFAKDGKLADADRAYLARTVAARTGVDEPAAQARVDEAARQAQAIAAQAKAAADAARKAGIVAAFILAASLLIGGAGAAWAATLGGKHRDRQTVFPWLAWR